MRSGRVPRIRGSAQAYETVTQGAQTATLWYRDKEGFVRNVILRRPDALIVATSSAGVLELRKTHDK